MIVIATWPLMLRIEHACGRRRWLAVVVMTVAMLLVFVVPFWVAVSTIVEYSDNIQEWAKSLKEIHLPMPPDWVGRSAARRTEDRGDVDRIRDADARRAGGEARPLRRAGACAGWRPRPAASVLLVVQFLLTIIIAAVMYAGRRNRRFRHPQVRRPVRRQARRGRRAARLARDSRRRARRRRHGARPGAAGRDRVLPSPAFRSPAC